MFLFIEIIRTIPDLRSVTNSVIWVHLVAIFIGVEGLGHIGGHVQVVYGDGNADWMTVCAFVTNSARYGDFSEQ